MNLLEYEQQIFLDAFHEDGLLVMAKGLGIERIFLSFLKVYCDPANLVLVLNTTNLEEDFYIEQLERENVSPLPKSINNEFNANERQKLYLQGGVLFLTSRILTVDLLCDRVPVENITGILVARGHKIAESCQEAFILRLFRQKNKTGFIKSFSHNATGFMTGFNHVERTMKSLYVRRLFLWPRFQANVQEAMDKHKIDVVEIHVPLTDSMVACQAALLDLINACVKELKRYTTAIDTEEITVENAISKSFEQIIRLQLDPVWHQLGAKSRQLVSDIKTLRLILRHLTQYDCVTFYNMVNSVKTSEKQFGQNTGWLFLEAADNLFVCARLRLYGDQRKNKKPKPEVDTSKPETPQLEVCPKWTALGQVMEEIASHNAQAVRELGPGRVLIAAEDDRTCAQIREYLCDGSESLLGRLYNKSIASKGEYIEYSKKKRIAKQQKVSDQQTLTQMEGSNQATDGSADTRAGTPPCSSQEAYFTLLPEPVTVIHPLHGCSDPFSLVRTLGEVQPTYVVLYDPDMEFVRQLEVYRATHPDRPLRVYFLMYVGSVEEQRYLTSLRKEKEAFEYLIREKGTMVIPEEREGKNDTDQARDTTPANAPVNTRKGGQSTDPAVSKVIVDMREFRSELPSLIHRRGIEIEPVTLEVGDYILTPEICVERKSVSDLIGSLNNGRLYNQCVSMTRYYKKPMLLIEFDPSKPFSIQGKYPMSSDVTMQETTSRLSLLTIHFPNLRILWCQSPHASAEIFEELKAGKEQPDAATAAAVTALAEGIDWSDRYNHTPQDMLIRMPGVNFKNYKNIMNRVRDIAELCTLSMEELQGIMGTTQNAKLLWDFLHTEQNTEQTTSASKPEQKAGKRWSKSYKR
ncbi:DNA repair endonuclease XPF-like [Dreissena polymorpha]|uniref:DNA repair endonuclease XPF-like n=1 Tax=Dreissena polymorpha TaxID=45954 RepID=UPI0022646A56|nr:DNA repair endonuclease XPF-like [Dreissena polymorpha]XP_052256551.1 DNA repair endonuclease XPF-like [Dreissena polymorpha]XP_052256552.1 DNA repair endonuclease XPF-like [Dreissena polymorpha]